MIYGHREVVGMAQDLLGILGISCFDESRSVRSGPSYTTLVIDLRSDKQHCNVDMCIVQ